MNLLDPLPAALRAEANRYRAAERSRLVALLTKAASRIEELERDVTTFRDQRDRLTGAILEANAQP